MARKCDICGKKVVHGNRTVHKHSKGWRYRAPKTKRIWVPNLRNIKVTADGVETEVRVCMSCYRRYQQDGLAYIKRKNPRLLRKIQKQVEDK